VRRISALTGSEHLVTLLELWRLSTRQGGWRFQDNARELGACDPWESRLVLVFTADLEEVEEVRG